MLLTQDAGFEYVKKIVRQKHIIKMVDLHKAKNSVPHLLIEVLGDYKTYQYYYVLYKKTYVHSFNYLFPDFIKKFPEFAGHGESINVDCLEFAKRREATLLYVYPDGKIYSVESNAVYKLCVNNKLSRLQNRRNEYTLANFHKDKEVINEKEYLFPIKLFERYY